MRRDEAVEIMGITFVGTRTEERAAMTTFVRDVLGLAPGGVEGADADFFTLPDGSSFAASPLDEDDPPERTVGFRVRDVEVAARELRAAGVQTDEVAATSTQRYVHFHAPDGRLYELVEEIA
jgi:catechol 2,3-dioxygenase-like lactoylglutathione lyase family enzyme